MSPDSGGKSDLSTIAPAPKTAPPRNEGTWSAVSAAMAGTPFPNAVTESISLTLSGEQYEVNVGGQIDKGTCITDVTQSPHQMTIQGTEGPNAGKTMLAIFDFPGDDEMRICYDLSGAAHPTVFESTPANKFFLVSYARKK